MIQQKLDEKQVKQLESMRTELETAFDWKNSKDGYGHWLSIHSELSSMIKHGTGDGRFWVEPEPPKPTYRPFANAKEFRPYRNLWFDVGSMGVSERALAVRETGVKLSIAGYFSWADFLRCYRFECGTPCGVKVETTHAKIES